MGWVLIRWKEGTQSKLNFKMHIYYFAACFHYLSVDVRSEPGQHTEETGNGRRAWLRGAVLSEAGFVLANSMTYFSMSGSGNRAGPEPYCTYLQGKDSSLLLAKCVLYFVAHWQRVSFGVQSPCRGLFLKAIQYLIHYSKTLRANILSTTKVKTGNNLNVYAWQETLQTGS